MAKAKDTTTIDVTYLGPEESTYFFLDPECEQRVTVAQGETVTVPAKIGEDLIHQGFEAAAPTTTGGNK